MKTALKENDDNYRNAIISLTAEKAHLEKDYTELLNSYTELQEHLVESVTKESPGDETGAFEYVRRISRISSSEGTVRATKPLFDMSVSKISVDDYNGRQESRMSVFSMDRWTSISRNKTTQSMIPNTSNVIQEYLHITAAIVKLHFPDMKDITSKLLIDTVKNSPFYLYHDLMMNFMRVLEREKEVAKEEEAECTPITKKADGKQSGWISRFLRLTQVKPRSSNRMKPGIQEEAKYSQIRI